MLQNVTSKPTICILIMERNESHCILDTLKSTLPYANEYIICDTGSIDNTIEICNNFFAENKIKGQIFNHEWKRFDYNYSILYQLGNAHSTSDYLWQIDADDIICGTMDMGSLLAGNDSYIVKFGDTFVYYRPQIFKTNIRWKHVGIIHGYVTTVSPHLNRQGKIDGDYYINSRREGDRYKNIDPKIRYAQDAQTLEEALLEEPDNARYVFYLAQCYFDSEQYEKSIINYKKRVSMKGWNEEIYYSLFRIAECCVKLNESKMNYSRNLTTKYYKKTNIPTKKIISHYLISANYDKRRAEPLYHAGNLYLTMGDYKKAKKCFLQALQRPYKNLDETTLFVSKDVYDWKIMWSLSETYCYLNHIQQSYNLCIKLLNMKIWGPNETIMLNTNISLCVDSLMKKWIDETENGVEVEDTPITYIDENVLTRWLTEV